MRYCSVFSGVEAASLAFVPLGWQAVCFSEIDEFPSAVLKHRYPEVPNLGDIMKINWKGVERELGSVDLVVGGSPCQSFSIAGTRTGLSGESGLMWEYVRCVRELMPRWLLWENVPGALSSSHGEDFRCLLESLDALGYGLAWRVLDAQFFGVPQRRERLFVVGSLGDEGADRACSVLFEPESLSWSPQTSREKRASLASGAGRGPSCSGFRWNAGGRTALSIGETSPTVTTSDPPAICAGFKYSAGSKAGNIGYEEELAPTVTADYHCPALFVSGDHKASTSSGVAGTLPSSTGGFKPGAVLLMTDTQPHSMVSGEVCGALSQTMYKDPPVSLRQGESTVRRLTPRECERLQGMPDDWTRVPYRGKPAEKCPDTPRYKAIGNSMAVPVMRWIGRRIDAADGTDQRGTA